MSDIVIKAENLGKKYVIGHQAENVRYVALRDVLVQNARSIWHKTRDLVQGKPIIQGDTLEEVWALKDVSCEVRQGEVVGIIGRNGAGKSTLLKILSRITEPTQGRVRIRGRVGSLLEVGTGFHPELTGRENIFLNGAVLGMTREEIKRKFDEIVAFAEVEKFLDTPVKRYSSGMYVRLAFAVAAHLEPEILLVDEVLAVGDAAFQKKCLGKMGDVAKEGRTVLFVSHNMAAVRNLCDSAFLLEGGHLKSKGSISEIVPYYLGSSKSLANQFNENGRRHKSHYVRIVSAATYKNGNAFSDFEYSDELEIRVEVNAFATDTVGLEVTIKDSFETPLIFLPSGLRFGKEFRLKEERNIIVCKIPHLPLAQGRYYIDLAVVHSGVETLESLDSALSFDVNLCDPMGKGVAYRQSTGQGSIHIDADFGLLERGLWR